MGKIRLYPDGYCLIDMKGWGKDMIWDNDDFFGGVFDFNGDGQTDAAEAALGYQILDEMDREDDEDNDSDNS